MGLKIGLDFGTSNSGVAISDGAGVRLLPIDPGNPIPEVVKTILYITRDHRSYIGQEAIELYYQHNVNRVRRFEKRWAGAVRVIADEVDYMHDVFVDVDVLKPGRLLQYLKTALRKSGGVSDMSGTLIFERYFSVGELIKIYLAHLKQKAEQILDESITGVTLGRPVKFSEDPDLDRQAETVLRQAALDASFRDVDFELEPIAAALFYEKALTKPQTVLIFDFGGGTLDITIMRLGDAVKRRVYANGGIDIAGADFDRAIIENRLLHHFGDGEGQIRHMPEISELIETIPDWMALPDLSTPMINITLEKAIQRGIAPVRLKTLQSLIFNDLAFPFYNQVETAKMALSEQGATVIELQGKDFDLWEPYTRTQFETDIQGYYEQIEAVLLDTVNDSGLEPEKIDAVVKTGGSSSIPMFSEMLGRIFGEEKIKESDAFSSVTAGLAIRASEE
ncbi:MAG: Hsp70 family protein [Anaerolineales bacterium]|nr:Hsp70 family protein [Chloroflexota bacterium]MBL6980602.1 Hsp70 family protein [Anaerolineales bacterium]